MCSTFRRRAYRPAVCAATIRYEPHEQVTRERRAFSCPGIWACDDRQNLAYRHWQASDAAFARRCVCALADNARWRRCCAAAGCFRVSRRADLRPLAVAFADALVHACARIQPRILAQILAQIVTQIVAHAVAGLLAPLDAAVVEQLHEHDDAVRLSLAAFGRELIFDDCRAPRRACARRADDPDRGFLHVDGAGACFETCRRDHDDCAA